MNSGEQLHLQELADTLVLGNLLDSVRERWGSYKIVDHWKQGEFHHDVVLELEASPGLPGRVLVVATNCNGGVKEILCLSARPDRGGLWRSRCPENLEFSGPVPSILAMARTAHWFDPRELLVPTARSEYREEQRERQSGGGWVPRRAAS